MTYFLSTSPIASFHSEDFCMNRTHTVNTHMVWTHTHTYKYTIMKHREETYRTEKCLKYKHSVVQINTKANYTCSTKKLTQKKIHVQIIFDRYEAQFQWEL